MDEKVGELTNEKTKVGRPVYKTPEGDKVSEISVTIPLGNKWINVPSIHDGVKYSEDELIQMLKRNQIEATSVHDSVEEAVKAAEERSPSLLAKGGSMESQMKMFEAGGVASQKDKMSKAFSEMDEMLENGISEEVKTLDGTTVSKTYKDPTYAAEDLLRMLRAGEITVEQAEQFLSEQKESGNYAKGGFEQGGLYQEGGTTDPVSGNEVPTGSLQEEVRDDIDAKLSEGEFVFPADVVRYIGLENLMQLRQKAKEGLGKMEDMGQMGNSEEAIMDDDLEYNADIDSLIDEFDPDEPDSMEFAVGGAVPGLNIPSFNSQSYMSSSASLPSYSQFMGGPSVPQYSSKQYIGPNGDIINITFLNGNPVQQIPEGYKVFTGQVVAPKVEAPEVKAPQDRQEGGKTREEEKEEEQRQADFKMTADVLARNNPAFAAKWAEDPFNTGKFTGLPGVFKSIDTALSMTGAIEEIAEDLDIDLGLYENTGLSRLGGKYDSVSFAKSLAMDEEDAYRGKLSEELKEEQEKKANEKRAATRAGMTARAGVVPSTSAQRRGVDTTREMFQTVRQQELANRESTEAAGGRSEWAGSDYDGDGKDDERDNEVSGFDDPTSESYGELAKGGLLAPRTPRKAKAKQTTSTRGKGLARKK